MNLILFYRRLGTQHRAPVEEYNHKVSPAQPIFISHLVSPSLALLRLPPARSLSAVSLIQTTSGSMT